MYEVLKASLRKPNRSERPKHLRSKGWLPGTIFGKGAEAVHFKIPALIFEKFRCHSGKVFEVEVEGGAKHLVNIQELQWNHLGNEIIHIAFHKLEASVKTKITVPIQWVGSAKGHKEGGVVHYACNEIELEGLPKDMPEHYEVDISELEMNSSFHFSDLIPPTGCLFTFSDDRVLVSIHPRKAVEKPSSEGVAEITPLEQEKDSTVEEKKAS